MGHINEYINKNRPLLVFAPSGEDPGYQKQRAALDDQPAGLADREVVVLESFESAAGPSGQDEPARLRKDFGVGPGEFAVVLVGKDGSEKRRWSSPVAAQEVFGVIDSMPMRQGEVHQRRHGDHAR